MGHVRTGTVTEVALAVELRALLFQIKVTRRKYHSRDVVDGQLPPKTLLLDQQLAGTQQLIQNWLKDQGLVSVMMGIPLLFP